MTREEAIKVIDLNKDRLSDSMRFAVETIMQEFSLSSDVDEAAEVYSDEHNDDCFDAIGDKCPHIVYAFKAGAEWQMKRKIETSVMGTAVELGETYKALSITVEGKDLNEALQLLGVKDGDKVRLGIIKEERI